VGSLELYPAGNRGTARRTTNGLLFEATRAMWKIEFLPEAARDLDKLDPQHTDRILKFLNGRVSKLHDPRAIGAALRGSKFGGYWKYRVGDYRIISKIEDDRLIVVVVRVAHRREVYR